MKNVESVMYSYLDEEKNVAQERSEHLHTTLPIDELIGLFANELNDSVEYNSFEYEHAQKEIHIFLGSLKLHKCQYKIKESGMELGKITLTRDIPFKEEEMVLVERALGALSIHLNNAIEDQSKLVVTHSR